MENLKTKWNSLYFKLFRLLLFASVLAGLFFFLLNEAGNRLITWYVSESNHIEKASDKCIEDLQTYVEKNHIASNDSAQLTRWVKKQKIVAITVYKEERLIYDSYYPEETFEDAVVEGEYYEWESYYTISFADGEADVFLYGFFTYQFYQYALIAEILLSVALLILIVIVGIRKTVGYIKNLEKECEILGRGNLEYLITVKGKDEVSMLASGLDNMRKALKESMEKEEETTRANRRMITEMSHDLRTPLTSLLLYTEILEKREFDDPVRQKEYIQKIHRKAKQIKTLSDHIFEYALITEGAQPEMDEPKPFMDVFYDLLSEVTAHLEEKKYRVEIRLTKDSRTICVSRDYINRIMDNLVSNIEKYADIQKPVKISTEYFPEYGMLSVENWISGDESQRKASGESTGIGVSNIAKMMKAMNGSCRVERTENKYKIALIFGWDLQTDCSR